MRTKLNLLGKIEEIRTVCNPILKVYDHNNDFKFEIECKFCQCGYCCSDLCTGKCSMCEFMIYDTKFKEKKGEPIGRIIKDKRSGRKMAPDYDQLEVDFPTTATAEDKILLTCAGLFVEYLYFQHIRNRKRCNGNPTFTK